MVKCMLTERITFQKLVKTDENENGFENEIWEGIYTCWANKRDISGKEFLQLDADKTLLITSFTVRFCELTKRILENYDTKIYRIVHKGNIFDIEYPYNVKNENNFIDFKCKLIK